MVDRRLATITGAALTASAGLAFARVFDSGEFVAPVLVAATLPFLIGTVARSLRAGPVSTTVASVVAAIIYLLIAVDHWNPLRGLPDLDRFGRHLRAGWEVARTEVPPVAPTTGTVLLIVAAVWIAGLVVDQMMVQRATTGALAPPFAVFLIATTLGDDSSGAPTTIGFALAACAFLLFQHQALGGRRGEFVGRRLASGTGLVATGTALAVLAVGVGVVFAPALPGADGEPLLDYRGLGGNRGGVYEPGILPVVNVGDQLDRGERTELFRVRADRGAYWRLLALDHFEGNWTLDAPEDAIDEGLDEDVSDPLVQEYRIGPLGKRWMPAAYRARRVSGADARVIRASTTLVTESDSVSGLEYVVESDLPMTLGQMTPELAAGTARPVPNDLLPYTALPSEFSPVITDAAFEVTAGAATPFDQALALRDYFRGPTFTYDLNARYNADNPQDGEAVIEEFLDARRGFCVQFASAFALMARSLGIPTRLVVGFTPGTREGDEFVVTNYQAHAWPEVWLAGVGWTNMFDPTPPSPLPGGSDLADDPPVGTDNETPATSVPTSTVPTTTAPGSATSMAPPTLETIEPDLSPGSDGSEWLPFVAVPVVLVALAATYVGAVLLTKRRRRDRRRRAPVPGSAVVGAWREAVDRLAEADIITPRTSTALELSIRLSGENERAGAALSRLAHTYGAARYGDAPLRAPDAAGAWEQVAVLERALEEGAGLRTRWRRRLRVAR